MEFDMDRIGTIASDAAFFEKYKFEVTAACMRLEPNTDGMLKSVRMETRIKALNEIAKLHKYGPFAHLCDECIMNPAVCIADADKDIMFGWAKENNNVCFCRKYEQGENNEGKPTIKTEAPYSG